MAGRAVDREGRELETVKSSFGGPNNLSRAEIDKEALRSLADRTHPAGLVLDRAAIDALKAHPALNATIDTDAGEVTYFDREHVAFAVDTEKGLLTPVVKDAGDLSVSGLAKKIADVAERTRTNKIGPDELSGGTFTITNIGSQGALFDTPILVPPQAAMLGTGAIVKRPMVVTDRASVDGDAPTQPYVPSTYRQDVLARQRADGGWAQAAVFHISPSRLTRPRASRSSRCASTDPPAAVTSRGSSPG